MYLFQTLPSPGVTYDAQWPTDPRYKLVVTAEDEQEALKRATALVKEIDSLRRQLELPPEMTNIVVDLYLQQLRSVALEREEKRQAAQCERLPMPIRSRRGDRMHPGRSALELEADDDRVRANLQRWVVARPQRAAYRIDGLQITRTPAHWRVHEIRIGNRAQLMQAGTLDGAAFREDGILRDLKLETAQTAMDIALLVEYVGPNPDGEVFEAVAVGLAA